MIHRDIGKLNLASELALGEGAMTLDTSCFCPYTVFTIKTNTRIVIIFFIIEGFIFLIDNFFNIFYPCRTSDHTIVIACIEFTWHHNLIIKCNESIGLLKISN
ncbi:MAG: hypothetical protein ACOCVN_02785, partial [bacterium]